MAFLRFLGGAVVVICVMQIAFVLVGRIWRRRSKPVKRTLPEAGPVALDDPRWARIDQEIARGRPIDAIRMARQIWGLPLDEAMTLIKSRPKV